MVELEFAFFWWTLENKIEFSISEIGQQTRWES